MKILKNASIYVNGTIKQGALLIKGDKISKIIYNDQVLEKRPFLNLREPITQIDCDKRLILPGLIDIHTHLRDMAQSEKETFFTGTRAAALNGITTVFNMPNTSPPAIDSKQIKLWLKTAKKAIFIDVGFIAGIPTHFNRAEIRKIRKQKIVGFKIYPHNPLNGINWTDKKNLNYLFEISSKYNIPIFFHPEWPSSVNYDHQSIIKMQKSNILSLHDENKPYDSELRYIKFVTENYIQYFQENSKNDGSYPIIHLCHISCKQSFDYIHQIQESNKKYKISMEVTPHHLLLNKNIQLENPNIGKVDPPLRNSEDQTYLYDQLIRGNLKIIASDHAPHTIDEKSKDYIDAPSGFPEFDTYPLILLDKVFKGEIPLRNFVQACSENPALTFNLKKRGFIRENYYANLFIVEEVEPYLIDPSLFKSKAKFSPYKGFKTRIQIWKVFYKGIEMNKENKIPKGKIIAP